MASFLEQSAAEIRQNNLQELAETTFRKLIDTNNLFDTTGYLQTTYRSAIKYFLRFIFQDDKVRKIAPGTRQLLLIENVIDELNDAEKKKFMRLLCQMERDRCKQAIIVIAEGCGINQDNLELTGSICHDDIWPTDLDIIMYERDKIAVKQFKDQLASFLRKKVDIKIKNMPSHNSA